MTCNPHDKGQRLIDGRSGFWSKHRLARAFELNRRILLIDGGMEVKIQGSHEWETRDFEAILDSMHVERAGF